MQKFLGQLSCELLFILPKNLLSYWFGVFMHIEWPKPLRIWLMSAFAKAYSLNLQEAEKSLEEYASIGVLFVRRLKPHCRPISVDAFAVHPADADVTQSGKITDGLIIQAKGKKYTVSGLTQDASAEDKWSEGEFLTYYLCPTDYHRVHSPVEGYIRRVQYIPGHLWPVNSWSVQRINNLFCVNERVVVEIETARGLVGLVMVGATNVGKMTLSFEPKICTNQLPARDSVSIEYFEDVPVQKGQELGCFHMGSTVIMLYAQGVVGDKETGFRGVSRVGEVLSH